VAPNAGATLKLEYVDGFGSEWLSELALASPGIAQRPGSDVLDVVDPHRLFWSAARTKVDESLTNDRAPTAAVRCRLTVLKSGSVVSRAEIDLFIQTPGVSRRAAGAGLVGSIYEAPTPSGVGILVLGGSGGGMTWSQQIAALLASKGHHALGLAYFNAPGLPSQADRIPLEYFYRALERLAASPGTRPGKIVILAQSWSTQAALLIAAKTDRLGGVICYVPGSAAFQAIDPPTWDDHSSWTLGGRDVPFVTTLLPHGFSEPQDNIERWMIVLANRRAFARGAIPVEQIRCPTLLLSSRADRIWPSTYMAEQVMTRAGAGGPRPNLRHLSFADAGHAITLPPYTPTTTGLERNGGTAQGNAEARRAAWDETLLFLERLAAR
jgi:dienelactone hydrolase